MPQGSSTLTVGPITLDDPPSRVVLEVELSDGAYVCTSITVERLRGGPPITSEALHAVPVRRLIRENLSKRLRLLGTPGSQAATWDPALLREQGPTDWTLEAVAFVYRTAVMLDEPPVLAVRDHFGIPRPTAARWVEKARQRGFLGPAAPGRSGERSRRR
jgi:hypothetical protein